MKKFILFFLFMITSAVSFAYDFEVNGVYYNKLSDNTCEVTSKDQYYSFNFTYTPSYSGLIVIEKEVTYEGKTYSVISIGDEAFYFCSGLTSVTIPNSVLSIGSSAFSGCSGLTSVTIPNSVTSIGGHAFSGCSGLTSVTIPNSVTSIGAYAFWECSGLTSVTIPNSVTSIGSSAFWECSGLTSVTIPNSVTSIGQSAFDSCKNLKLVHIRSIESWCNIKFENSNANPLYNGGQLIINNEPVSTLVIPNSVTSIGNYAFYGCSGLTSVTIPNSVTSIGSSAFESCSGLISVTIPNSVTSIGKYTFYGCKGLTSVTIPNSVTSIGKSAFSGCSGLTSVVIPNSVTSIGSSAFYKCSRLLDVTVLQPTPLDIQDNVFDGIHPQKTLHVLKGCKDLYSKATGWKSFYQILDDATSDSPDTKKCAIPTITLVDGEVVATCETEGAVCYVTAQTNATTASGTPAVTPTTILTVTAYATADGYEKSETATREFKFMELQGEGGVKGDTNGDGQVTVTDIVKTAGYILTGEWGE